ncbi:MAG: DUF3826 domain-containing protein [Tepidisphaeraceae bacterium]
MTKAKLSVAMLFVCASLAMAQSAPADKEAAYAKMIDERADKIMQPLKLDDAKRAVVKAIMLDHYRYLRQWDDANAPKLKELNSLQNEAIKAKDPAKVDALKEQIAGIRGTKSPEHEQFIRNLVKVIPFTQVNAIKDGMSYNYVNTRMAIMEKLGLTPEQRTEIRDMLVATREIAMDAGTSDEKHKLFGETLGRISLRVLTPDQNAELEVMKGKPRKTPTTAATKPS